MPEPETAAPSRHPTLTTDERRSRLLAACDRVCGKYAKHHKDRCPLYKANCAWMDTWNRRDR